MTYAILFVFDRPGSGATVPPSNMNCCNRIHFALSSGILIRLVNLG
jgi:hypothetical protein